jgi:hypothetical protein
MQHISESKHYGIGLFEIRKMKNEMKEMKKVQKRKQRRKRKNPFGKQQHEKF